MATVSPQCYRNSHKPGRLRDSLKNNCSGCLFLCLDRRSPAKHRIKPLASRSNRVSASSSHVAGSLSWACTVERRRHQGSYRSPGLHSGHPPPIGTQRGVSARPTTTALGSSTPPSPSESSTSPQTTHPSSFRHPVLLLLPLLRPHLRTILCAWLASLVAVASLLLLVPRVASLSDLLAAGDLPRLLPAAGTAVALVATRSLATFLQVRLLSQQTDHCHHSQNTHCSPAWQ